MFSEEMRKGRFLGDKPKIARHFFQRPPCLSCPEGEVMPQVMEGEILDQFPLALGGLSLERAEPIVDPFFRQTLAALRHKYIGPFCVASGLQVLIERLACFVHQIDITPLAPLIAYMEPSYLWTHMGMRHLQPGDIAHPASCPVAQGKKGCPPSTSFLLDQRAQDRALIFREFSRSEQRRGGKIDATCRVALEQSLLLNQKLGKIADGRFHPRPVVETQPFLL